MGRAGRPAVRAAPGLRHDAREPAGRQVPDRGVHHLIDLRGAVGGQQPSAFGGRPQHPARCAQVLTRLLCRRQGGRHPGVPPEDAQRRGEEPPDRADRQERPQDDELVGEGFEGVHGDGAQVAIAAEGAEHPGRGEPDHPGPVLGCPGQVGRVSQMLPRQLDLGRVQRRRTGHEAAQPLQFGHRLRTRKPGDVGYRSPDRPAGVGGPQQREQGSSQRDLRGRGCGQVQQCPVQHGFAPLERGHGRVQQRQLVAGGPVGPLTLPPGVLAQDGVEPPAIGPCQGGRRGGRESVQARLLHQPGAHPFQLTQLRRIHQRPRPHAKGARARDGVPGGLGRPHGPLGRPPAGRRIPAETPHRPDDIEPCEEIRPVPRAGGLGIGEQGLGPGDADGLAQLEQLHHDRDAVARQPRHRPQRRPQDVDGRTGLSQPAVATGEDGDELHPHAEAGGGVETCVGEPRRLAQPGRRLAPRGRPQTPARRVVPGVPGRDEMAGDVLGSARIVTPLRDQC